MVCLGDVLGEYHRRLRVSHKCERDASHSSLTFYSFTATVPTIIQQLGYSSANAQLLTIPIYVFAMIITLIFAFWSDRVQQRSPFIIAGFSIAACGFIAQLAIPHPRFPGLSYGFLFPVAAGLYCPFVPIVCWIGKFPNYQFEAAHPLTVPQPTISRLLPSVPLAWHCLSPLVRLYIPVSKVALVA